MGVRSGSSRVADLAVSVFGRSVHPEWFGVRAHQRIVRTGWEADVRLIHGGHAVQWASGSARISEVLLSIDDLLPEFGLLTRSPIRRELTAKIRPDNRTEYQACYEVERLEPRVFARLSEELTLDPAAGDLFEHYPSAGRMNPPALSRIHVEPRSRGLSVQAYHTFPDESAIVRTQALFEIRT